MSLLTFSFALFIFDFVAYSISICLIVAIFAKTRFEAHLLLLSGAVSLILRSSCRYSATFYTDPNNEFFLLFWRVSYFFLFIAVFIIMNSILLNSYDELPFYTHIFGVICGILIFSYFNEDWINPVYSNDLKMWYGEYELIPLILFLILSMIFLTNITVPVISKIKRDGFTKNGNLYFVWLGLVLILSWGITANAPNEELLGKVRLFFLPLGILIYSIGHFKDPFIISYSKTKPKMLFISNTRGKILLNYNFEKNIYKEYGDLSGLLAGVNSVLNEIMQRKIKEGKERVIDRGEEKVIILGVKNLIAFLIVPSAKKMLVASLYLLLRKINDLLTEEDLKKELTKEKQKIACTLIEETINPLLEMKEED